MRRNSRRNPSSLHHDRSAEAFIDKLNEVRSWIEHAVEVGNVQSALQKLMSLQRICDGDLPVWLDLADEDAGFSPLSDRTREILDNAQESVNALTRFTAQAIKSHFARR